VGKEKFERCNSRHRGRNVLCELPKGHAGYPHYNHTDDKRTYTIVAWLNRVPKGFKSELVLVLPSVLAIYDDETLIASSSSSSSSALVALLE
jgi:hypothetical protein